MSLVSEVTPYLEAADQAIDNQAAGLGIRDRKIIELKKRIKELEGDKVPPPDDWDVRKAHRALVSDVEGYAKAWGVNGGDGGEVSVARTHAQLKNMAGDSKRRIILLHGSLNGETWRLRKKSEGIKVRDNKTIWGVDESGQSVDLKIIADWKGSGGAFVCNDENAIISGINGAFGQSPRDDDGPDFVQINRPAEGIWIDRLTFHGTGNQSGPRHGDGVVDCYGRGCSWTRSVVYDARKVSLVKGRGQLTLRGIDFFNCGGRFPHVGDDAVAQVERCTIDAWYWGYAMLASEDGRLVANDNMFRPSRSGQHAIHLRGDGKWTGSGNQFNGAKVD